MKPGLEGAASGHPRPTLAHVLSKRAADAVAALYFYVRPGGDHVLVRSDLDALDDAFAEVTAALEDRYDGRIWTLR